MIGQGSARVVQQGWFISIQYKSARLVHLGSRATLKMAHSNGWQVGESCQLGAEVGLWAEGPSNFPVRLRHGLHGLPHSMVAEFQESNMEVHGVFMT